MSNVQLCHLFHTAKSLDRFVRFTGNISAVTAAIPKYLSNRNSYGALFYFLFIRAPLFELRDP